MGKRPYYLLEYITDYDGYDERIIYLGTNYKAAINRYKKMVEYLKQWYYIDEGVAEEYVNMSYHEPPAELTPGRGVFTYINDGDSYYMTIALRCLTTNKFLDERFENKYREDCPDAKY